MTPADNSLQGPFPGLAKSGYTVTSLSSAQYNCIAWALGRDDVWVWPDRFGTYNWPPSVPREVTITAFIAAFGTVGYRTCNTSELDEDVEKVAIYALEGRPTHAARQLRNGAWTSKLGSREDITHSLDALEGDTYGSVVLVLSRPRIPV
jgi:hypothetical protein